ncbi:MAG: hypothetical protein ABSE19_01380 [Candidatus Acidiferrum sp.]|jgi:hypothetical protein
MGLLSKLFGTTDKRPAKPYVDAGMRLTQKLITSLRLGGWENHLPVYSPEEIEVIKRQLEESQRQFNEAAGGTVLFHPEAVETLQRMQTAQALEGLAGEGWLYSDRSELPKDWATRVSTFLKAFACGLNPSCLQQVGELLVQAGYKTEAREAFEVVLLFPTYASTYYGGAPDCEDIVAKTVNRARDSLGKLQDLPEIPRRETAKQSTDIVFNGYPGGNGAEVTPFNPKAASWLRENAKVGRWILDGQCMQLPMSQVAGIITKAREAGFVIKTNRI